MNNFYTLFTLLILGFFSDLTAQVMDPGRGMYVNRFFRTSVTPAGNIIIDPNYSILGIAAKEDSLLTYARDNHITYLILYDVHRVFGNAAYEGLLCSFIQKAKSDYCINKIGVASSCAAMYDNVASIEPTNPYSIAGSNYPQSLSFIQNSYSPNDPMFYLSEATKMSIRATTFNDDCSFKIDVLVTEFEFWNSGTDNCTDQNLTKDQKYQNYQSLITYMDAIRDHYNSNHSHQIYVETYLGYLSQNTAYSHQTIANWIDGSYNGKRRVDRILLHYYSADPTGLYSRTSSGANYSGYYLTRFVDFSQSTTNPNSTVLPIFSTENINWGAGSNFFGAWFNLNVSNNIFTAEKIWYNEWFDDAHTFSSGVIGNSTYGNTIDPGSSIWFTSFYMMNHLERPVLFTSNSPVCVSAGQTATLQFQYQGPIEQGINFSFYLTDANDTTLRCGSRSAQNWPQYDGVTHSSIDLNAALNGCTLPLGDYDAHLELQYSNSCSVQSIKRISVVTSGVITALTPTTQCQGNPVYLQASSTGNGTGTYQWYKGNQSISGATAQTYAPVSTGTSDYSCKITSSNSSCSANRTSPISVSIYSYPSASISVQSSSSCGKILKASPSGASYLWPDGSTGSTYSASRGGYYSAVVSTNGCKSVASYTFNNVKFDLEEFNAACPGDTNGNLKIDISGGSSPYTLNWTGPSSGSATNLLSGNNLIENLGAGNYTVVVTDNNGCSFSITALVPLAANPNVMIGVNSPVCSGQSISFTSGGGSNFNWTGPNGFTSAVKNPVIQNAGDSSAGMYYVTVTNQNGCSATDSINVNINSPFTAIAEGDTVCKGADANLTASGGNTYQWSGPSGFTSSLQNPIIQNIQGYQSGVYNVVVSDNIGCTSSTTANVIVHNSPVAIASNDSPVCVGSNLNLHASGGVQYLWNHSNVIFGTMQDTLINTVTTADSGVYQVIITDSNLCSDTAWTTVTLNLFLDYYIDEDGDGYGSGLPQSFCLPQGLFTTTLSDDCNDHDSLIHPLANEICYNGIDENCNGMGDDSCANVLHVKLFLEGFYLGNNVMTAVLDSANRPTICDSITVQLHSVLSPYQIIYSRKDTIDISGNGLFEFPPAVSGNEYYVSIRHRNSLETWSEQPVLFSGSHVSYNFTTNAQKAFGSNLKNMGDGNFAIISGDLNQNGNINSVDLNMLQLGLQDFAIGYTIYDLTGDYFVDSSDFSLLENNLGIAVMRP